MIAGLNRLTLRNATQVTEEAYTLAETPKTPEEILKSLTETELRTLGLHALGWSVPGIARYEGTTPAVVKSYMRTVRGKLGIRGAVAIALWYVEHSLPTDVLGLPRDPNKAAYTFPGEKYEDWCKQAELRRAALKESGLLSPHVLAVTNLLTDLEHADKPEKVLADLLSLSAETLHSYMAKIREELPGKSSRVRIAVIAKLAPFDAE